MLSARFLRGQTKDDRKNRQQSVVKPVDVQGGDDKTKVFRRGGRWKRATGSKVKLNNGPAFSVTSPADPNERQ